jgi:hypothetical protein
MDNATILGALRDYFLACPLTGDNALRIDWLPERGVAYSIDTTPATEILRRYVSGSTLRQYIFVLRSVNDYGADTLQNLANCGFFEQLASWMEIQTRAGHFPDLGVGRTVRSIEAQSTAYLFTTGPDTGKYQIQCRIIYFQKGTR